MTQAQHRPAAMTMELSPALDGSDAEGVPAAARGGDTHPWLSKSLDLSGRWFVVVFATVFILELLVAIPMVANHRRVWLDERAATARMAAFALDIPSDESRSQERIRSLLDALGAQAVAVHGSAGRQTFGTVAEDVDRKPVDTAEGIIPSLAATFRLLVADTSRPVWIAGPAASRQPSAGADQRIRVERVDLLVDQGPLQRGLRALGGQLLVTCLSIAAAAAGLISLAIRRDVVRPVRRLALNIGEFANDPEGVDRRLIPSRRRDEIGRAETALAQMQASLADELRERRRLAGLGLSVSKINHELRNLLTTAQLLGDRLEGVADPLVQRVAPRLVTTLDRAIRFCEATLAYGRATEPYPTRQHVLLGPLLSEMEDLAGLSLDGRLRIEIRADPDLSIYIDPDQFSRALTNIVRNAVQALDAAGRKDALPLVTITACRQEDHVVILLADNGPGLPKNAKATLFAPFQSSMRAGGTGLGLAIASELIFLNGGTLDLDEATTTGACFRIVVPQRPRGPEEA